MYVKDHYSPLTTKSLFLDQVYSEPPPVPLPTFRKFLCSLLKRFSVGSLLLILRACPVILELQKWPKPRFGLLHISWGYHYASVSYLLHQGKRTPFHHSTSVGRRKIFPVFSLVSLSLSRKQIKRNLEACYCMMYLHCIMRGSVCGEQQLSIISKRLARPPPWSHHQSDSSQPLLPQLLQLSIWMLLQELWMAPFKHLDDSILI